MTSVLLSGSPDQVATLAGLLRVQGQEVVVADSRRGIATLAARVPSRSMAAYVQLPMHHVGAVWPEAVTERITALALAAPLLSGDAAVFLVAGDPDDPIHEQRVADGLRLLAEAALSGSLSAGSRVSVLHAGSLDVITRALSPTRRRGGPAPLADFGIDRDYADWRTDVLSLTSACDETYFGWSDREGRSRVGVLRGSVMSPLSVPAGSSVAWGKPGPGTRTLGQALIAEVVGDAAVEESVVDLFVKDIIERMPPEGFELSISDVRAWLRRYLCRL